MKLNLTRANPGVHAGVECPFRDTPISDKGPFANGNAGYGTAMRSRMHTSTSRSPYAMGRMCLGQSEYACVGTPLPWIQYQFAYRVESGIVGGEALLAGDLGRNVH